MNCVFLARLAKKQIDFAYFYPQIRVEGKLVILVIIDRHFNKISLPDLFKTKFFGFSRKNHFKKI